MAERSRQVPVSMDEHLLAALDRECEASERNRSQVIRYALRRYLLARQQRGGADEQPE